MFRSWDNKTSYFNLCVFPRSLNTIAQLNFTWINLEQKPTSRESNMDTMSYVNEEMEMFQFNLNA